jgi:hypothetical protein
MKYRIESWKFSIAHSEDDYKNEFYYSTKEAALASLEKALVAHLRNLDKREDISPVDGSKYYIKRKKYKDTGITVKVGWWKKHPHGGVIAMKDYYYINYDLFEREVLE